MLVNFVHVNFFNVLVFSIRMAGILCICQILFFIYISNILACVFLLFLFLATFLKNIQKKNIYKNLQLVSFLMAKHWMLPLKGGNRAKLSALTALIKHHIWRPSQCSKTKRNKMHTDWNERSKTIFTDMIACIKNTMESTKYYGISDFRNFLCYKINIHKTSIVFLYFSNK